MRDSEYVQGLRRRVEATRALVIAEFGDGLDATALNRKPAPDSWSIAECLEHLLVSESAYIPFFDRIARGEYSMSTWQRFSPLSGLFGRLLVKSVTEEPSTKMKAPALFQPSTSAIDAAIVSRYLRHMDDFLQRLGHLEEVDLDATIITSPPMHFITYSLRDALTLLVQHQVRHVNQAIRAKAATA